MNSLDLTCNMLLTSPLLLFVYFQIVLNKATNLDKRVLTLIDTGSSISVCSENFARQFSPVSIDPIQVYGIIGNEAINKYIKIKIKLGTGYLTHKVFVVPSLRRPLILGNDLLYKEECLINFMQKRVIIKGESFPMHLNEKELKDEFNDSVHGRNEIFSILPELNPEPRKGEIEVRADTTLELNQPGYQRLPVYVNLQNCGSPTSSHVFQWNDNFLSKNAVLGPELATTPSELQSVIITSMGPQVIVRKHTKIGKLIPIVESYHITTPDIKPVTVPTKDDTPTFVNGRPTQMTEEHLDSLKFADDLTAYQKAQLRDLLANFSDIFSWDEEGLSDLGCFKGPYGADNDGVRLHVKDHPPRLSAPLQNVYV